MAMHWQRTFIHAGRSFTVLAETHSDPDYLEVSVRLDGSPLEIAYPGNLRGVPSYGVSFSEIVSPKHQTVAEDLMATAEADVRRRFKIF